MTNTNVAQCNHLTLNWGHRGHIFEWGPRPLAPTNRPCTWSKRTVITWRAVYCQQELLPTTLLIRTDVAWRAVYRSMQKSITLLRMRLTNSSAAGLKQMHQLLPAGFRRPLFKTVQIVSFFWESSIKVWAKMSPCHVYASTRFQPVHHRMTPCSGNPC